MMKSILIFFVIFIFCTDTGKPAFSQNDFIASDFIALKDSLKVFKKIDKLTESTESKNEIVFNEKDLAPENVRIVFNDLFKQYLSVKDALVYNDSFSAKRNTLLLIDDLKDKTKDIEILNKDDRWVFLINNYTKIRNKAESTTFISEQRFLFNEITFGLIKFIKQFGLNNKTIYIMNCNTDTPVGNASWFSDKEDRKNPYLGLMNDTLCAEVKEVWKFP